MNDIPTLIDVSWMIRGLGYGVVLGTAIQTWLPFQAAVFAGVSLVIGGQYLAFRWLSRPAAA
jgi:hypothetical protein